MFNDWILKKRRHLQSPSTDFCGPCTLARPRTGSVLASETPCHSDGFEIGFGLFFSLRFFGDCNMALGPVDGFQVFFCGLKHATWPHGLSFRMCGRSNFGCPVSRKVSQISTMSSNHSNSPTWKPPNPQTTRNLGRIPHTKVPLSTFHWLPITNPPPPASTVRSHDFPGTDGGVVLRMRRCGLGVRPGDKPEGPAAAVALPGCTLAHPKNDGLENASRFKHG